MFYKDSFDNRYYTGVAFNYNGYYYGRALATNQKFSELGFTQVTETVRPDPFYYNISGPDLNGQYTSTPKSLADVKAALVLQQKIQAREVLRKTDWYIIRNHELTTAIPSNITAHRAAWRTASDARCAEINATSSVSELETLYKQTPTIYNTQTETGDPNPDAMTPWPVDLDDADTYTPSSY